ncbi:hypothetical protein G6F43_008794 [Rhizopus delemar]|nr:hypothetical protein G6F43_008794 [Rhizopus delemar]
MSSKAEMCYGCCFCKDIFSDIVNLRQHIDGHVTTDKACRPDLRKRKYKVHDVQDNGFIPESDKWHLEQLNVSDTLFMLRKQIIQKNERTENSSDVELLVLDHIFVFAQEHEDSIPGFGLDQHDHIVQSIDIMKMPARDMDFLTRWCSKLATLHDPSWHTVKVTTTSFLAEAVASSDPNELLAADIIHTLAGRLIARENKRRMLEDTFAHKYLDAILETVFGSERRFRHDWANGSLLGIKRKRQDDNNDGSESSDADDDEEHAGDQNDNDENHSSLYKPDWVVYTKSRESVTAVGVMELKVIYKRNPSYMTDFVKLAKQMKLILHHLVYMGDLALQTAISIESNEVSRQLGQSVQPTTSLAWLRPSTGFPEITA